VFHDDTFVCFHHRSSKDFCGHCSIALNQTEGNSLNRLLTLGVDVDVYQVRHVASFGVRVLMMVSCLEIRVIPEESQDLRTLQTCAHLEVSSSKGF